MKKQPSIDDLKFSGTKVVVRPDESIEQAIKRFKKICLKDGIMADWRKHQFYESASVKRKKKSIAAQRKLKRKFKD